MSKRQPIRRANRAQAPHLLIRVFGAMTLAIAPLVTSASAHASVPPNPATPDEVVAQQEGVDWLREAIPDTTAGGESPSAGTGRAASFKIVCTPKADAPHVSSGAGGVIYKTRVSCVGTGAFPSTIAIRVRGGLFLDSASFNGDTAGGVSFAKKASSIEDRIVSVNGATFTFYTPQTGQTGAHGKGHWMGTSTIEILVPTGQTVGSSSSSPTFINKP